MATQRARIAVVLSVVVIDMLGIGLAFPILPKLIQHFVQGDFARASVIYGLLGGAYAFMQFLVAPLLGAISDRVGRRPVLLLALFGMGINYLVLTFAPDLMWLAIGRIIAGAMGATYSTAGAYMADITPPEKRAQSFGLIGAAFGFGFICGPALGGLLGGIDLRLPFAAAAALSFLNLIFGYFILPESLAPENRKPFRIGNAHPIGALREVSRFPAVAGLLVIFVTATFANRVAETTWVLFAAYKFHWNTTQVGLSLALVGVMFVVGQGVLVRVVLPLVGERRAVIIGLLIASLVCAGYGLVPEGWMVFPLMAVAMFGWTTSQPAVQGLLSRAVPPSEQGLLQGAIASLNSLTAILGPVVWPAIFAYFVSASVPVKLPGAAYYVASMVFFVAMLLAARWLAPSRVAAAPSPAE
jgi:MFS transporter, DHA1 family, tetracycline resistance protein